ncbi:MAG: methionine adenosyltransferase [Holophaga sp.]|nr:methionine adenosyltransferase [Holophaga sp.]
MANEYLFTSESVSEGHPDKVADQISDAVLDWLLARDPHAKVACETLIAKNFLAIAGEFRAAVPDLIPSLQAAIPGLARGVLTHIGYTAASGFDPDHHELRLVLNGQSDDIDRGVERGGGELGAGDQGLMFGYACTETPELMPQALTLAHRLVARQALVRRSGKLPFLRPDAKSQVTLRYRDGQPVGLHAVVLSTQHEPDVADAVLHEAVREEILVPVLGREAMAGAKVLINPTGRFVTGGPEGDTGVTGRKIIVDTYGGSCPHGGGAFSGKDPSKVDRSAAYAARWVAKHLVAAGAASRCTIQVAYAIGVAEPVSLLLDFHGTGALPEAEAETMVRRLFDLRPAAILEALELRRPIYLPTAAYGHFGREQEGFSWERTSQLEPLQAMLGERLVRQ